MQKAILNIMINKSDLQKIKALAIDCDGTMLLPDTTLGERTAQVLRKLISEGMQIILSTGRAVESSERYYNTIGAEGPMVFFNGAKIVDVPSGRVISCDLVDMEVLDFGLDLAHEMKIHFQMYLPSGISPVTGESDPSIKWESLLVEKPSPETEMYYRHTGIPPVVINLKSVTSQLGLKGAVKGMFIADPSLHDEIRRKMNGRFSERINITRSFPTFLELLKNGVSKGEGLKTAMKHRGLVREEVIAFGDDENDLSMFDVAGFSVATSNAIDKNRNAANLVIGSNADEGLAVFLEESFL
jgi:Cof subfamily protein (haloacid dehalogenase superfamily)